jgi:hypothetical protein
LTRLPYIMSCFWPFLHYFLCASSPLPPTPVRGILANLLHPPHTQLAVPIGFTFYVYFFFFFFVSLNLLHLAVTLQSLRPAGCLHSCFSSKLWRSENVMVTRRGCSEQAAGAWPAPQVEHSFNKEVKTTQAGAQEEQSSKARTQGCQPAGKDRTAQPARLTDVLKGVAAEPQVR